MSLEPAGREFLGRMMRIAREGGEIALDILSDSSPTLKEDGSAITRADVEVSRLAKEVLGDLTASAGHMLIDEEDSHGYERFERLRLDNVPYIWALDPIDGTRSFANGMPTFGISIGLLRNLKPWLGAVYFPMLAELFYCDGERSFFVEKAFTRDEQTRQITPVDQKITRLSIFLCNDSFSEKFVWNSTDCQVMNPACAVLGLCWPAIGRGCGAFFGAHIWDFAGSWPIFRSAGLSLRSYQTGRELERLDTALFAGERKAPWKLREHYILSSERNFAALRQKVAAKDGR